jgi:hypothetical protein
LIESSLGNRTEVTIGERQDEAAAYVKRELFKFGIARAG